MKLSLGGSSAGLVMRTKEIQLLAVRGDRVVSSVRIPIAGSEARDTIQAIQQALSEAAVKTRRLSVSIHTQDVLFRFFTIPVLPKPEWDTAVQFEARKYIPFKTESLVWDYRVARSDASSKLEIIFTAIPIDRFQGIQDVLHAAGVQPTVIEPRSLSLARLMEPARDVPAGEFACLVDVESNAAHLAICRNALPYLTRDIALRVSDQSAQQANGQGVVGGSLAGESPGSPSGPGGAARQDEPSLRRDERTGPRAASGPIAQAGSLAAAGAAQEGTTDSQLKRLMSELSVSMDFFVREYPSTRISKVFLFGEEGQLRSWPGQIADQLHCPVELGTTLLTQRVSGSLPLSYAAGIGLVQGKSGSAEASLDFLTRSLQKGGGAHRAATGTAHAFVLPGRIQKKSVALILGLYASLLLGVWLVGSLAVAAERRRLGQLVRSAPALGWELGHLRAKQLQGSRQTIETQLMLLQGIIGQRVRVASRLDALARSLPDGVWLTGLVFEDTLGSAGISQYRMTVSGACFLDHAAREFRAIQDLGEQVKGNSAFFAGFSRVQLDQGSAKNYATAKEMVYRTFELKCVPERKL